MIKSWTTKPPKSSSQRAAPHSNGYNATPTLITCCRWTPRVKPWPATSRRLSPICRATRDSLVPAKPAQGQRKRNNRPHGQDNHLLCHAAQPHPVEHHCPKCIIEVCQRQPLNDR